MLFCSIMNPLFKQTLIHICLEPNTIADKFGYEFHGYPLNYLRVDVSGTTVNTFDMDTPATLTMWIYVVNSHETQYIFCKSNAVNNVYVPRLCIFIQDGYYWGQVQYGKNRSDTPAESNITCIFKA